MWQDWADEPTHGHTSKFLLFWAALFVWVGSLISLKLVFNAGDVVLTVSAVIVGARVLYAFRPRVIRTHANGTQNDDNCRS